MNRERVASDVASLHTLRLRRAAPDEAGEASPDTVVLDENGNPVPTAEHGVLTGSKQDGTLFPESTCRDWTSAGGRDYARFGRSDVRSWNSAGRYYCTPAALARVGSRLYCFAAD